jgi:membrane protein
VDERAGTSGSAITGPPEHVAAVSAGDKVPPRFRGSINWLNSHWPGRIVLRSLATFVRIDMFDRSMTIAAQFFTSVLPILILFATLAAGAGVTDTVADAVSMPEESRSVFEEAVETGGGSAFGLVGALMVLASATSLSRALSRAFTAIWTLPRPKTSLGSAWRWLAVVLAFAFSLVVVRGLGELADPIPPTGVWPFAVAVACDLAVAGFVPWVLLSRTVPLRRVAPGALVFALLMLVVRPATAAWLPRALDVSADRYGTMGVAFTYLALLYVASFCFLATAVVGQVIATDGGRLGQWIRGSEDAETGRDLEASSEV